LTAPQFVAYLEEQLDEKLKDECKKIIPPPDKLPALTRAFYNAIINHLVQEMISQLIAQDAICSQMAQHFRKELLPPNDEVETWIKDAFAKNSVIAWDTAVRRKLTDRVLEKSSDIEDAVRSALKEYLASPSFAPPETPS
jgi:hypothetical protein